jgi:hypothetical protein
LQQRTNLDCEGSPLTRDWRGPARWGRDLAGSVGLHSSEEAALCAVLCHLAQDTCGPDGGLEELRKHVEWSLDGDGKRYNGGLGRLSVY